MEPTPEGKLTVNLIATDDQRLCAEVMRWEGGIQVPHAMYWGTHLEHEDDNIIVLNGDVEVGIIEKEDIADVRLEGKIVTDKKALFTRRPIQVKPKYIVVRFHKGALRMDKNDGVFQYVNKAIRCARNKPSPEDWYLMTIFEPHVEEEK